MKKKTVIKVFFSVMTVFLALTCTLASIKTKKIKADGLSDLTNTTWILNQSIYIESNVSYNVNSTYDDINFMSFDLKVIVNGNRTFRGLQLDNNYDLVALTMEDNPVSCYANLPITFTGGSDITNSSLISWLQNNATQQGVTPSGTKITHKYWASYLDMNMTDNEVVGDNDISYTVLLNFYTNDYNEQTLTGLAFTGVLTNFDNYSYIISPPNEDILYQNTSNTLDNPMLLEFTLGDYMDSDLYDLMNNRGVWFDDARAYMAGTNYGSLYGFNTGRAYGQAEGLEYTNLISTILNSIGSLLSIQIFPHITIALILGLPLLLGVFIIIIKILRG